ncbi:MAG TPA: DUF1269 domain-containing protein [Anaerolineae bacterium]|nr:DUF1269 domain-containing protein [Anaerolineae bacterium]
MATLTVLKFESAGGAEKMLDTLKGLSKQELIKIHDAAIVNWPEGKKKPKTRQLVSMAGAGALSGAFWGMLFGILFLVPLFGMAVGAAMGALSGAFADYGIDDDFIKSVREKVTEGTSALFLLSSGAVMDKIVEAVKDQKFEIIASNLSKEEEDNLRAVFAEEE